MQSIWQMIVYDPQRNNCCRNTVWWEKAPVGGRLAKYVTVPSWRSQPGIARAGQIATGKAYTHKVLVLIKII